MKCLFLIFVLTIWNIFSDQSICPDSCLSYFDGCNECDCSNPNSPVCTLKFCEQNANQSSRCTKCSSNFEWNDCGSICTKTCDDPSPICIGECYPRCECPKNKPILLNGVCVAYNICTAHINSTVCPKDCSTYFDGCNFCNCYANGSMSCTPNVCTQYSQPYCASCKSNLEWTTCGSSCTPTCSNTSLSCNDSKCVEKCQCPSNKPIYHNGVCLPSDECFNFKDVCPDNCTIYNDGCNNCTCLSGLDACTNRNCFTTGTPQCTKCTSNMEWNDCGSSCTKTCSDPSPLCIASCLSQCECPANAPILKNGTCIPYSKCDCKCQSASLPNGKYLASRTKKCQKFTTQTECKTSKNCLWKCQ